MGIENYMGAPNYTPYLIEVYAPFVQIYQFRERGGTVIINYFF